MKFLPLIILFILCGTASADQRVFYNPNKNMEIVDITGKKTVDKIKEEFGDADYQEIEILEDEVSTIENGVLGKRKIIRSIDPEESLIQKKIAENQRAKAISDLKQEGKLPQNFPDK